ncbi:MAG: PrpR N-terminal domain-containing protein [Solobacterium sp.]|nr:PrpR N-terminal domain-containing protein [Solobacterium sp.]
MKQVYTDTSIIRILAVAPYQGLKEAFEREAKAFPQIQLDAVTGDLEEGVRLAEENFHANYDILISRGGTASLLRERVELPVTEVAISVTDILQAIHLSSGYFGKRAIVGFPNITESAGELVSLLDLDIEIFTLTEASDIRDILNHLKKEQFQTIICDVVSSRAARDAGFDTILITSGRDSIRRALSEAQQEVHSRRTLRDENLFLRRVLTDHSGETVVFLENGVLYFSTAEEINPELMDILRENLSDVKEGTVHRFTRSLDGYLYTVKATMIRLGERIFYAYYYNRSRSNGVSRSTGISYYVRREVRDILENSFFRLSGEMNAVQPQLEKIAETDHPLLITGEYGTGRSEAAMDFYLRSTSGSEAYVDVDMQMMNERSREFLMNSPRSPLFYTGNVIHLKNLGFISESYLYDLFHTLHHADVCRNNRVIFSGNPGHEILRKYIRYIKDSFGCMEIELLPLRANAERIPAMVSLYLSQRKAMGKTDVIRVETNALRELAGYAWPGNYTQMERVLNQLFTISRDHLVHAEDVTETLRMESSIEPAHTVTANYLNLNRSLEEIEKEIVQTVIRENNGNQTAAARQLGISRTTLWRMIK